LGRDARAPRRRPAQPRAGPAERLPRRRRARPRQRAGGLRLARGEGRRAQREALSARRVLGEPELPPPPVRPRPEPPPAPPGALPLVAAPVPAPEPAGLRCPQSRGVLRRTEPLGHPATGARPLE